MHPGWKSVQGDMENRKTEEVDKHRQDCCADKVQANTSFNHLRNGDMAACEHNGIGTSRGW